MKKFPVKNFPYADSFFAVLCEGKKTEYSTLSYHVLPDGTKSGFSSIYLTRMESAEDLDILLQRLMASLPYYDKIVWRTKPELLFFKKIYGENSNPFFPEKAYDLEEIPAESAPEAQWDVFSFYMRLLFLENGKPVKINLFTDEVIKLTAVSHAMTGEMTRYRVEFEEPAESSSSGYDNAVFDNERYREIFGKNPPEDETHGKD